MKDKIINNQSQSTWAFKVPDDKTAAQVYNK